uniref:Uncharacterized protein n=1 Tax=Sulfolobus islandicus rod-shaped virus 1 TaxID=157898 RepID=Q5W351_SIRV1|nr:hypothetical protein [Sulfolobus islandicus rod-shaped virus 1]
MVKMSQPQNLSQLVESIKKLIQKDTVGIEFISFKEPIDMHIQKFELLIDILSYENTKHYWFIAGSEEKRYDLFVFDNAKELKRIVIESHFNVERIFVDLIQLIRYPR